MSKYIIDSALILGAITILLLLVFRTKSSRNNIFLALSLFSIWFSLLINYLNQTQLMMKVPFFFRTGNISGYLILSFLYIYARNTFYPGVFWRRRDFLLLVPCAFYIIDMFPVFLLPPEAKIAIMKSNFRDPRIFNQATEGWITFKGFHNIFRYVWAVMILTILIGLIIRNRYFALDNNYSYNRRLYWFIVCLTALRIPLIFPGILGALLKSDWFNLNYLSMDLSAVLLTSSFFFLATPTILYGFLPKLSFQDGSQKGPVYLPVQPLSVEHSDSLQHSSKAPIYLKREELDDLIGKIEFYMQEKLPFLNNEYTIHDLSRDIGVPVYHISPIINQCFGSNFSTWINKYRINHFISLCLLPEYQNLTLDALAKDSGFSNRTTFNNAFKKEKNQTPGVFLKHLQAGDRYQG